MQEPVHLHRNILNRDRNIYLLLLPPFVYVLILFLFYLGINKSNQNIQIATGTLESSVLGEEIDLDIKVFPFSK